MSGTLKTGKLILTQTTSNNDAFDRLRVSEPSTLFEINHSIGKLPFLIDEYISGAGATSIAILDNSYIAMRTTAGSTGCMIRQSYEYIPYQPGKSKMMIFSGVLEANNGGSTGILARIGCFDNYIEKSITGSGNGLFFELDNKTLNIVERLNLTGATGTENRVSQNNWNNDKFDGTGPSGITGLDFSKGMIFAMDQEWLGVGRVRFGFYINGKFHVGHILNHSGVGTPTSTAITHPYTKTSKLPIRYEISSTGQSASAEMRMICSTVLSEGGYEPTGMSFSYGRTTGASITSSTITPIIAIKLIETEPSNRKTLLLKAMSILNSTTRSIQWQLYVLEDKTLLEGTSWTTLNIANSACEYSVSNMTFTPTNPKNILIDSGFADAGVNVANFAYEKYLSTPLVNSSITGLSKVLCLCGIALTGTAKIHASLTWIEII